MNLSHCFLNELEQLWNSGVPEAVRERTTRSLLDYLAVTCAGARFQRDKLKQYFEFAMPEPGAFRLIGTGQDLVLKEAVFLNGLNGHALDFDDGTNSGIIHLGSPVFSLLIPLAQRHGITVQKLLDAAVIGYETSYTMAVSIQPRHKALGYHATGTCGTLGAAIAASYMLDFTPQERFQAFAAACIAAGGMLKALDDTSELKPYNVGKTALMALTAIQLAKSGFKGPEDPLAGRGFLKMMTREDSVSLKPVRLNGSYAVMKSYTKPYASCRYTHPSVEAAIRLRGQVAPGDVKRIVIRTYGLAVSGHDHTDIPGSYSAKMSIPYAVAVGLIYGRAGFQEFEEKVVGDEEVLALTKKVHVSADDGFSEAFPQMQTAVVTIETADGCFSERVDYPKGEPENPLTDAEFRDRYDGLMTYAGIAPSNADALFRKAYSGQTLVDALVKLL